MRCWQECSKVVVLRIVPVVLYVLFYHRLLSCSLVTQNTDFREKSVEKERGEGKGEY